MRKPLDAKVRELREATGGSNDTGWMHDEVCWLLFGLIRFYRPSLVIQTGHLWGKSALVVLEALKNTPLDRDAAMGDPRYAEFVAGNRPPSLRNTKLVSIDPNPLGVPNPQAGVDLLNKWYPNLEYHKATSAEYFASAAPSSERIFGVVDGDHHTAGARADLQALAELKAGMILLDDTSWIPALAYLTDEVEDYAATEFPEYNGVTLLTRIR